MDIDWWWFSKFENPDTALSTYEFKMLSNQPQWTVKVAWLSVLCAIPTGELTIQEQKFWDVVHSLAQMFPLKK